MTVISAVIIRKALVPIILALLVGSSLLYRYSRSAEPKTIISCDFEQQPGTTAIFTPDNIPIRKLHVEGRLKATTPNELLGATGSATWANGETSKGSVSGNITLADNGGVKGLVLSVTHPNFARDRLRITTLNREGQLDYDRDTAFLFFDPLEKFLHPANYVCRVNRR